MSRCEWCDERTATICILPTAKSSPLWVCDQCLAEMRDEGKRPIVIPEA